MNDQFDELAKGLALSVTRRAALMKLATCIAQAAVLQGPAPVWAAPTQQAYVKASNTGAGDYFGLSVAVSGDTMVVGAIFESSSATGVNGNQNDNNTPGAGAAYVFVRSGATWTQQAYLKSSSNIVGALFGGSVAVSGDTVMVGASNEGSRAMSNGPPAVVVGAASPGSGPGGSGAVYIFARSGENWSQQAFLKSPNPGLFYNFGSSVAVSGDTAIVGEPGAEAAYVFVRNGTIWSQQAYLTASNAEAVTYFGRSVALSGDTVIVGAQGAEAAYVFVRSGTHWSQQAYLKAPNTGGADFFGSSVAVSGDTAVVGAVYEAGIAQVSGAAYVFARSGTNWSQQAHLKASNPGANDDFGHSVAISGDTVVIGAVLEDSNATGINGNQANDFANDAGAAYVFVRRGTNWSQQAYLKASNAGSDDRFGEAVAVSGSTVVVGAGYEDSNATGVNGNQNNNNLGESGAVYVFAGLGYGPGLNLKRDGSGGYFVRFTGAPDVTYRLQRAAGVTGTWINIATKTAPASGLVEFHDTTPLPGQAYYRTVQP